MYSPLKITLSVGTLQYKVAIGPYKYGCRISAKMGGLGGVTNYIEICRDVRKIWDGFFDSNHKYGCGISAKNGGGGRGGVTTYIEVCRDVRKIWGGFFSTQIINMGVVF